VRSPFFYARILVFFMREGDLLGKNSTTAQVGTKHLCCNYFDIKDLCRPFRAKGILVFALPRAMPWADKFCPFRAKAKVDKLLTD